MSLAFQALVVLFLLLAGLIHRHSYNGKLSKDLVLPQNFPPLTSESVKIIIATVLLHGLWVGMANILGQTFFNFRVDLSSALFFIMGDYSTAADLRRAMRALIDYPYPVMLYFLSLYAFAALSGLALHRFVRGANLDIKYRSLRFNNEWHYLLYGEIMSFPESQHDPVPMIDGTIISAVLEGNEQGFLYVGVLVDYFFDRDGNLDRLLLRKVCRRNITADRPEGEEPKPHYWEDARYYQIDGDYFMLRYADIKNLNVKYLVIEEQPVQEDYPAYQEEDDSGYSTFP